MPYTYMPVVYAYGNFAVNGRGARRSLSDVDVDEYHAHARDNVALAIDKKCII